MHISDIQLRLDHSNHKTRSPKSETEVSLRLSSYRWRYQPRCAYLHALHAALAAQLHRATLAAKPRITLHYRVGHSPNFPSALPPLPQHSAVAPYSFLYHRVGRVFRPDQPYSLPPSFSNTSRLISLVSSTDPAARRCYRRRRGLAARRCYRYRRVRLRCKPPSSKAQTARPPSSPSPQPSREARYTDGWDERNATRTARLEGSTCCSFERSLPSSTLLSAKPPVSISESIDLLHPLKPLDQLLFALIMA